jgi:hypothetical protein
MDFRIFLASDEIDGWGVIGSDRADTGDRNGGGRAAGGAGSTSR